MVNKIEFKQKAVQQQQALQKLDNIRNTVENSNDPALKSQLGDIIGQMTSDINYFRDIVGNTVNEAYADGIIDSAEIAHLDRVDDFMYTQVNKLANCIHQLQAAGIAIPSSLQSDYDFLFRKMLEAKSNTAQARKDFGDNNSYENLNLSYEGVHPVQNRTAQKRISIRATPEAQKLLKEMGLYREIDKESLATKRFRDVEYGRTA